MMPILFIVAMVLAMTACSNDQEGLHDRRNGKRSGIRDAKELFEGQCAVCHGKDGSVLVNGTINLRGSCLGTDDLYRVIANGRNGMPAFKTRISDTVINQLAAYVVTLRKNR